MARKLPVALVRRPVRWVLRQERVVLGGALLVGALGWIFLEIADEVVDGDAHATDRRILQALRDPGDISRPLGPGWLAEAALDWTSLGSTAVVTIVVIAVLGFLLLTRRHGTAALVLASSVGGAILSNVLKQGFDRPRPDLVPELTRHLNPSFPSGHAMTAAVVYLTLAALVATTLKRRREKLYVIGVALSLTLLVGLTRIYLGVHYPTDVLAGWCVGASWAVICWAIARALAARRVRARHETAHDGEHLAT